MIWDELECRELTPSKMTGFAAATRTSSDSEMLWSALHDAIAKEQKFIELTASTCWIHGLGRSGTLSSGGALLSLASSSSENFQTISSWSLPWLHSLSVAIPKGGMEIKLKPLRNKSLWAPFPDAEDCLLMSPPHCLWAHDGEIPYDEVAIGIGCD